MDKTKFYLDLSKRTEEEIIKIYHVLNDKNENIYHSDRMILKKGKFEKRFPYLTLNSGYTQWMSTFVNIHGKTELTYSQFLDMMEGKSEEVLQVDIYSGELNTERISTYKKLSEQYNIEESTVRDIFNAGADWVNKLKFK